MKLRFAVTACAALIILTGCASKEPLDYLPESAAYITINSDRAEASAGAKRLTEILQKLQPESADLARLKVSRMYIGIQGPGTSSRFCGVAEGGVGFPDRVLAEIRRQGGRDDRASGRAIVTTGSVSVSAVGDKGVIFYSRPEDLEKMVRASKRKEPQARQTTQFQALQKLGNDSIIAGVMDTSPVFAAAGSQLGAISAINPKGVEALKQVQTASISVSWDDQPAVNVLMHLDDAEARKDLVGFANFALGFVTKGKSANPELNSLLTGLKATDEEQGVAVKLVVPAEMANSFLDKMETTAQQLPANPDERKAALQKAFSGGAARVNRR